VFLAGQTGEGGTLEQQIDNALGRVAALLGEAGCELSHVVSCLVHLADLSLFDAYNSAYERHFMEPRPVRTTVGAALLDGALVEFTVIARRDP
jgi:enamine deaminase RidA (YjgF/YER057c/UK114 family)